MSAELYILLTNIVILTCYYELIRLISTLRFGTGLPIKLRIFLLLFRLSEIGSVTRASRLCQNSTLFVPLCLSSPE